MKYEHTNHVEKYCPWLPALSLAMKWQMVRRLEFSGLLTTKLVARSNLSISQFFITVM